MNNDKIDAQALYQHLPRELSEQWIALLEEVRRLPRGWDLDDDDIETMIQMAVQDG